MAIPVIAVFDVGKTNKKLFLFDELYNIVHEHSVYLPEITDDDGDPCEDLSGLTTFVRESLRKVLDSGRFDVRAVNFSGYGATFVYFDEKLETIFPIFNYLKDYPSALKEKFYATYGGEERVSLHTASPVLGSLNSGMQIYRLKHEQPTRFAQIKFALHLPQYLSFIVSGKPYTEITSLGCHTNLLDFRYSNYHQWVTEENIKGIFPSLVDSDHVEAIDFMGHRLQCGVGLHDSSAALIPYLHIFQSSFVLISTGTWNISLNPYNDSPLTVDELRQDCLCYMSFTGKPVKASRLFAGHEYDVSTKLIADHFGVAIEKVQRLDYDAALLDKVFNTQSSFNINDLDTFSTLEDAYLCFMCDLVRQQHRSTMLVLDQTSTKRIFVDGGFSKNKLFMNLLALSFPDKELYAAFVPQGSALGAAMAIHSTWNKRPIPQDQVKLVYYGRKKGQKNIEA